LILIFCPWGVIASNHRPQTVGYQSIRVKECRRHGLSQAWHGPTNQDDEATTLGTEEEYVGVGIIADIVPVHTSMVFRKWGWLSRRKRGRRGGNNSLLSVLLSLTSKRIFNSCLWIDVDMGDLRYRTSENRYSIVLLHSF